MLMSKHAIKLITKEVFAALKKIGKDFTDHSIFSPSGSAMWTGCSGSLVPNLFRSDTAGLDAAMGTVAHSIGEEWLKTGERPSHHIGTTRTIGQFEIEIDHSMLDYVSMYVDWCLYLPGVHFVETRVDHSDLTPLKNQTGTADHAVCQIGSLIITDLKFGKGNQVFAKNNTQGIIYAYGFFKRYDELFDFQTITIRIAQPRLDHFDEWTISRAELLEWAAWIKERAFAAWCKDAQRSPSEKACKWCKERPSCAAYAVFAERLLDGMFDNLDTEITSTDMTDIAARLDDKSFKLAPVAIGTLTTPQKAALLPYRKTIESWFKGLYEDLETRCLNGEEVPGYKIVTGRSTREFTSNAAAAETLDFLGLPDEVIHPRGMISPSQAEIELTKIGYKKKELPDLLKSVVRKPPGKPAMAPDTDKRQALASVVSDSFDNLDDEL